MDRLDFVLRLLWIWMAADVAIVAYLSFVHSRNSGSPDEDAVLMVVSEREENRSQHRHIGLVAAPTSTGDRF